MKAYEGIKAKLRRSRELIATTAAMVEQLKRDGVFSIQATNEVEKSRYSFRACGEVPIDIPLLVSEIVHHQRTALDHLVWACVPLTGEQPTNQTKFPAASTTKAFEDAVGKGALDGVPLVLQELIERHQPYNNTADPSAHALSVLQRINNQDKHHMLLVVAVGLVNSQTIVANGAVDTTIHLPPAASGRPLHRAIEEDIEVQWIHYSPPHPDTRFEVDFEIELLIRDKQDWRLITALQLIQTFVSSVAADFEQISEALSTGINVQLEPAS